MGALGDAVVEFWIRAGNEGGFVEAGTLDFEGEWFHACSLAFEKLAALDGRIEGGLEVGLHWVKEEAALGFNGIGGIVGTVGAGGIEQEFAFGPSHFQLVRQGLDSIADGLAGGGGAYEERALLPSQDSGHSFSSIAGFRIDEEDHGLGPAGAARGREWLGFGLAGSADFEEGCARGEKSAQPLGSNRRVAGRCWTAQVEDERGGRGVCQRIQSSICGGEFIEGESGGSQIGGFRT